MTMREMFILLLFTTFKLLVFHIGPTDDTKNVASAIYINRS